MKKVIPTHPEDIFSSGYDSSEELEENNFNSPEAKPENIFANHAKENSELFSSKILSFPFILDSYELINLKTKDKLQLEGEELSIILGNLDKIKNNELLLKLIFVSKDKKIILDLKNYPKDIASLVNTETEFIATFKNKLFIKYENENTTKEVYTSLQKSSELFDLLYEEENSLNISEDNSVEKFKKSEEKKEEKKSVNKAENIDINNENKNLFLNKLNIFTENNNSNVNVNIKKNLLLQNNHINKKIIEQNPNQNPISPLFFTPQIYNPFLFSINNFPKITPINPILASQIPRPNPFLIQTALAIQNLIKMQQQSQTRNNINFCPNNDKIDYLNNIKNKNQITNNNLSNINNNNINKINASNMNKNLSPINNKESSTNSNSSSSSSKDSSPLNNYQLKNVKNFNIESNNNIDNNKINNNLQKNIDYNLEEIVQNKQYKEYIPKNLKEKEKEKEVKFQTNSTRDYKLKYVSRYIVQIDNEKNFPVTKMIIGNNGMLLRNILINNCIKYGDQTTKIRLRGRGSGYKEGPKNEESKDPMELCISSLNLASFTRCSAEIENLLQQIYYQYYNYQCRNNLEKKMNNNNDNKVENSPIVMKKILKYHYVVNRYNTLAKEEKRRKEEEMNKINKKNKNDN